jgi:hypothetical protein
MSDENEKILIFKRPYLSPMECRMRREYMERASCEHELTPPVASIYATRAEIVMKHQDYLFEALQKNAIPFSRVSMIACCCRKCNELIDLDDHPILNQTINFYCRQLWYEKAFLSEAQMGCSHKALELVFFDYSFERAYSYGNDTDCDVYCDILAVQACRDCTADMVTIVSARDVMDRNFYEGSVSWFAVSEQFFPLVLRLKNVPEEARATRPIRRSSSTWHMPRD